MKFDGRLALILVCAIALAVALHLAHLPAAWLFGPLAVSALFAVRGWRAVQFPQPIYLAAQAVIGTALGAGFLPKTLLVIPQHIGIFSFAVVFIMLTSLLNGWLLARFSRLDAASAFLGTMPGGAGAMAVMSDSLGADTRLVTAVQYVRLLIILGSLAFAGPLLKAHVHAAASATPVIVGQPATFVWWKLGILALLAFVGWLVGRWGRVPAGTFLIPTLLYFCLTISGISVGTWPLPILAGAYLIMGAQIGGRFHPSTVGLIRNVILPVLGTTLVLLLASVALAWIVAREMNLSLGSAYLAATPGGLDSVAAVANDLHVDTTVVVAMHLVRLLCVLIFGPWLVRGCLRWLAPKKHVRRNAGAKIGGVMAQR